MNLKKRINFCLSISPFSVFSISTSINYSRNKFDNEEKQLVIMHDCVNSFLEQIAKDLCNDEASLTFKQQYKNTIEGGVNNLRIENLIEQENKKIMKRWVNYNCHFRREIQQDFQKNNF